jgi:hypothetical protein
MDALGGLSGRYISPVFIFSMTYLLTRSSAYHSSDDNGIPGRNFEKGLELFPDEICYVQSYLGFLISINHINSAYIILLGSVL